MFGTMARLMIDILNEAEIGELYIPIPSCT